MITIPPPKKGDNLRYVDVVEWLTANGYSVKEVRRMVEKKVIEPHYTPVVGRRAWYSVEQIKQALDGSRSKEQPT